MAKSKTIEVTQEILDLNPALLESEVEIGDEIKITKDLVLPEVAEESEEEEEEEEAPKARKGTKYDVFDGETYIRTYEDGALAKEFASKVATRRVVESK